MKSQRAYIGLGANLGDPIRALRAAAQAIHRLPKTRVVAASNIWRSAPLDASGPQFANAVVAIETALSAHALLEALHTIESDHGRQRAHRNAPRTLDLDVLLYGDLTIDTPDLSVPHPRMHLRRFVLGPLAQIDAQIDVPGQGVVAALLAQVEDQDATPTGDDLGKFSAPVVHVVGLTSVAMLAFAGNSLLCRLALKSTTIDPASFTTIRLASGALTLWLIVTLRNKGRPITGDWPSALALFIYAACFSWSYVGLTAATGALILFGAVQATMIGTGIARRDRMRARQWAGIALAIGGLVALLMPGLSAPPLVPSAAMLAAGIAWGAYSVLGRENSEPLLMTTGNFLRAVPLAIAASAVMLPTLTIDRSGIAYAVASGAITSGIGYVVWYAALAHLKTFSAASVQLSVPVIAALGGVALLDESLTMRLVITACVILGGIALAVLDPRAKR